jgi:Anti-sigma factor NepR
VELVLANSGGKDVRGTRGLPLSTRRGPAPGHTDKPGWADGLRQLYDSVLDEKLPESFDDLLAKLDKAGRD